MATFNEFEHDHRTRKVKTEGGRTIIEDVRQTSQIYAENDGRAGNRTSATENIRYICAGCSQETDVHHALHLLDLAYHRLPCGLNAVESIISQYLENPQSFDAKTISYIYMLRGTLRSERRWSLARQVIRFFTGN